MREGPRALRTNPDSTSIRGGGAKTTRGGEGSVSGGFRYVNALRRVGCVCAADIAGGGGREEHFGPSESLSVGNVLKPPNA